MFLTKKPESGVKLNQGDKLVWIDGGGKHTIVIPENLSEALKELEAMIDPIVSGTQGVEEKIEKIIESVNNYINKNLEFVNNFIDSNPIWNGNDLEVVKTITLYFVLRGMGFDVYYNEGTKKYYDFINALKNMTINREKYKVEIPHYSWLTLNMDDKQYVIDPEAPFSMKARFAEYGNELIHIERKE